MSHHKETEKNTGRLVAFLGVGNFINHALNGTTSVRGQVRDVETWHAKYFEGTKPKTKMMVFQK